MLLPAKLVRASILLTTAALPIVSALPHPHDSSPGDVQVRSTSGTWETSLQPMPQGPRRDHAVAALGLEVILVGGTTTLSASPSSLNHNNKANAALSLVEAYAPLTDSWRRLADLPIPITHANLATVHGRVYMLGGLTGDKGVLQPTGASYKFSPFDNEWEPIAEMPLATKRGGAAICAWKDLIVVAGGFKHFNTFTGAGTASARVTAYNTITKRWISYPDLPDGGRGFAGGVVWNDTVYVVGGVMGARGNVKADVVALDLKRPETGWKKKAGMLSARAGAAIVELNGKFYVFGGNTEGGAGTEMSGNVQVYDAERDEWEIAESMPLPRSAAGAAVVLGEIYLPGGAEGVDGGTVTNTMLGFIPRARAQDEL